MCSTVPAHAAVWRALPDRTPHSSTAGLRAPGCRGFPLWRVKRIRVGESTGGRSHGGTSIARGAHKLRATPVPDQL